ncbi:hypothetical protein JCM8097_002962 [Rhodosporidiobolus ruineniae]
MAAQRAKDMPSQNYNPPIRGTSDHMEYGIGPGLRGGEFSSSEEEALAKSNHHTGPSHFPASLLPSHDPLSASPEKPRFLERLAGGYSEAAGYLTGDSIRQEEGRSRRKFGSPGSAAGPGEGMAEERTPSIAADIEAREAAREEEEQGRERRAV